MTESSDRTFYVAECELCGAKYLKSKQPRFDEQMCQCGNLVYYKETIFKKAGNPDD